MYHATRPLRNLQIEDKSFRSSSQYSDSSTRPRNPASTLDRGVKAAGITPE